VCPALHRKAACRHYSKKVLLPCKLVYGKKRKSAKLCVFVSIATLQDVEVGVGNLFTIMGRKNP